HASGCKESTAQRVDRRTNVDGTRSRAPSPSHDLFHGLEVLIRDIDIAAGVNCNSNREEKSTAQLVDCGTGVYRTRCCGSRASNGLLHGTIAAICDKNIATGIHCHTLRTAEYSRTIKRVDRRVGVNRTRKCTTRTSNDFLYGIIACVSHIYISTEVHCQSLGIIESTAQSVDRRIGIDGPRCCATGACNDLLHGRIAVRDINVAMKVHCYAGGIAEAVAWRVDRRVDV